MKVTVLDLRYRIESRELHPLSNQALISSLKFWLTKLASFQPTSLKRRCLLLLRKAKGPDVPSELEQDDMGSDSSTA